MKTKAILTAAMAMTVVTTEAQETGFRVSQIGDGYSQTSVNTAVFRYSALATADSAGYRIQYACYYSPQGNLTIAKRRLDSDDWTIAETDYRAKVEDGHNVASMAVDGEGYIHIAYDHHGNKLHYRKSVRPYSTELGTEMPMLGDLEDEVTYPEFHKLPSGNLIFVYRTGKSGNGDMIMNRYDCDSGKWSRVQDNLIDGEGRRNAYWQMCTDRKGRIHLAWVWRDTWKVETNHDMSYAYSDDEGRTWNTIDGKQYELPITIGTADVAWGIPMQSELINQTSIAADHKGRPYIATYWRSADSEIPQYRIIWHDGKTWRMEEVSHRKTPFSLSGGGTKMIPISRPRLVIDRNRAYYIVRDEERGSRVTLYTCTKLGKEPWTVEDILLEDVGAWEPSIDEALWNDSGELHIFVQQTFQGDGEKVVKHEPTPVCVLEVGLE